MLNLDLSRTLEPISHPPQPFRFLSLPLELRQNIYRALLVHQGRFYFRRDDRVVGLNAQILRVSKQVFHEAKAVLYSQNEFAIWPGHLGDVWSDLESFGDENLGLIRMLHIETRRGMLEVQTSHLSYAMKMGEILPKMTSLEQITVCVRTPRSISSEDRVKIATTQFIKAKFACKFSWKWEYEGPACCEWHQDANRRTKDACRRAASILMQAAGRLDKIVDNKNESDIEIREGRMMHEVKLVREDMCRWRTSALP